MTRRQRKKAKMLVNAVGLGALCCSVIYASVLMVTAKSFLRAQTNPIDL